LNLALVSSDKTVRETTKRPHTLSAYLKVVDKAHRLGLKITSYQILGLPSESLASMIQTLAFNARLPVLLGASPFYMTPNAPIARGGVFTDADYVRSRLTAMALNGNDFEREDIYTLFVATRIVNFLKGLPLSAPAALADLFEIEWPEERQRVGFDSLRLLGDTGRLWSFTRNGWIENAKFRPDLFLRVLGEMEYVMTRRGVRITLASAEELLPAFSQAAR
jgi:hypothetical protein